MKININNLVICWIQKGIKSLITTAHMVPYSPSSYKKIIKSTVTRSHPVPGLIKEESKDTSALICTGKIISFFSHKVSAVKLKYCIVAV